MKKKKDKVKRFYCLDLSCCLYLIPTTTSIHTMMSDQYLTCPYFFYSEYMDGTLCGFMIVELTMTVYFIQTSDFPVGTHHG